MSEWLGQETWLAWGIGLLIGFPFLMILFGEMLYRIEDRRNSRHAFLANAQYFVLPSLVLYLLLTQVMGLSHDHIAIKIIASVFWISIIYLGMSTFNMFWSGKLSGEAGWQSRVPTLVLNIARLFIILFGVALVVSTVWGVDLGQMLAALGVGSIVLGLALQDTLGSLFAGITLISARQFQVGDWLKTGDVTGQVTAINWHSVTLKTFEDDSLVIPNSMLAGNTFFNYSRPDRVHMERITIQFCEDHPPNQVRKALLEAAFNTPGVLSDPAPQIILKELADDAGSYEALLYFADFEDIDNIYDAYLTRAWYAAKRHGVIFPFEDHLIYQSRATEMPRGYDDSIEIEELVDKLIALETFPLSREELEKLTQKACILRFGVNEQLMEAGRESEGLYVILTGEGKKSTTDSHGDQRDMGSAYPGDLLGLVSAIRHEKSMVDVFASKDVQLAILRTEAVESILKTNPQFAQALEQSIETRQKTLDAIRYKGMEKNAVSDDKNIDNIVDLKKLLQKIHKGV